MLDHLKILWHQGKQFIPDVRSVEIPGIFRGRPVISNVAVDEIALAGVCPTKAIGNYPISIDLGRCTFCGECALRFPEKIQFTKDYKISSNVRERLIVKEGDEDRISFETEEIRREVKSLFGKSLKLRQVSAGGDNSCELELNASNNVQFDMSRFGIDFVASPRHADGVVITGPITKNMAKALEICYEAIPDPKIVVLVGTDAISGGIFEDSDQLDRTFLKNHKVDLYIPGNPAHPLTIINGLLNLTGR
ncbi:MAG: NADH:ubiquinone oxidoreductase [Rikenellaceae bacterium]|nr:NADH:ubiquinone oxidoreductase [Rikenellaceae bacterium]